MNKQQLHDFASTREKGLPSTVGKASGAIARLRKTKGKE